MSARAVARASSDASRPSPFPSPVARVHRASIASIARRSIARQRGIVVPNRRARVLVARVRLAPLARAARPRAIASTGIGARFARRRRRASRCVAIRSVVAAAKYLCRRSNRIESNRARARSARDRASIASLDSRSSSTSRSVARGREVVARP
jgi:hypothetical protein